LHKFKLKKIREKSRKDNYCINLLDVNIYLGVNEDTYNRHFRVEFPEAS